jgi:hypothetical protein
VESLRHALSSSEEDLSAMRRKYHHYHVTMRERKRIWLYTVMDFSNNITPGAVHATIRFQFGEDGEKVYGVRGVRLGDLLLITEDSDPGKPVTHCSVYPFFGKSYVTGTHGISFHETWDFDPEFSPCLISEKPLIQGIGEGIVPVASEDQLDGKWRRMMEVTPINLKHQPPESAAPQVAAEELAPFRKKFFHYHLTRDAQGKPFWQCKVLDFRNSDAEGKLRTIATVIPKDGEIHRYTFQALILGGNHLLMLAERIDKDLRPAVEVFPFWAGQTDVHCSVRSNLDWGDSKLLSVGMLSEKQLVAIEDGPVTTQPDMDRLLLLWEQRMREYNNLIPRGASIGTGPPGGRRR